MSKIFKGVLNLFCILILIYMVLPLFVMIPLSFNDITLLNYPIRGLSLKWYELVFSSKEWGNALVNTLIISPSAALLATIIGTTAAISIHNIKTSWIKKILFIIGFTPLILPIIVESTGVYMFYAQYGLIYNKTIIILVHALVSMPFSLLIVSAALQKMDKNLIRTSISLGGNIFYTYWKIIIPMLRPSIVLGFLFSFILSQDEVIAVLLLAGPKQYTISRLMLDGIRENISPDIAVVSSLVICLILIVMYVKFKQEVKIEELEKR